MKNKYHIGEKVQFRTSIGLNYHDGVVVDFVFHSFTENYIYTIDYGSSMNIKRVEKDMRAIPIKTKEVSWDE